MFFAKATKRELTIVDQSGRSVQLTLWGKQASQYAEPVEEKPVAAFKGVTVKNFGGACDLLLISEVSNLFTCLTGRSLSALSSSLMTLNPDITEAFAVRGW